MSESRLSPIQEAALAQAEQVNQQLQLRQQLSDNLLKAMVEALETWAQVAQQPRHPAYPAARFWTERLVRSLRSAEAAAAGLTVVGGSPGGGNGRA